MKVKLIVEFYTLTFGIIGVAGNKNPKFTTAYTTHRISAVTRSRAFRGWLLVAFERALTVLLSLFGHYPSV